MNKKYYSRHTPRFVRYNLFFNEDNFLTPEIKKVIHNNPATIVFWGDGTKTVVMCQEEDRLGYSERVGLLMCIAKKFFGNTGAFNDILKEHSADDIPVIKIPKLDDIAIDKKDARSINIKN